VATNPKIMAIKFYNLTILKIFLERGMKKTYLNRHLKTTYMKPAAFTLMLVLFVTITANAQLSFLPQVGLEQSKTSLGINDLPSFSPMGVNNYLKANLRMDYRFKNGHSPYISFGTSPGVVEYSFADPSNAANNFKTAAGSLQFRMEGGYQYSSKAHYFKEKFRNENCTNLYAKCSNKKNLRLLLLLSSQQRKHGG
jgi:opacity protein-like surface antigen